MLDQTAMVATDVDKGLKDTGHNPHNIPKGPSEVIVPFFRLDLSETAQNLLR